MISLIKYWRTNSDLNYMLWFEIKLCRRVGVDYGNNDKVGISRTDGMLQTNNIFEYYICSPNRILIRVCHSVIFSST